MRLLSCLILTVLLSTAVSAEQGRSLPAAVFAGHRHAEETDAAIRAYLQQAAALTHQQPAAARPHTVVALELAAAGKPIAFYDHCYALYLLLKNGYDGPNSSTFGPGTRADYLRVARRLLDELERSGKVGQWVFTPEGQFYLEAYITAAGGLAWYQYEDAGADAAALEAALVLASKAAAHVQDRAQYWVHDTEVRILLALKREAAAWEIVRAVLEEDPEFADFRDLRADPRYRAWLARQ